MLELEPNACTGCGACKNACPYDCITMEPDERGFLYPHIDTSRCIECGACEAACPPLTPLMAYTSKPPASLAYFDKSHFRDEATSGAIFAMLAEFVLAKGGCVFGASYSSDMQLRHRSGDDVTDIYKFQGVKLAQSDTQFTMREARDALNAGRWVLYTGTPCQIEGFLAFLGREYETLITMDFVCAAVSSPLLLQHYLEGLHKDFHEEPISFRVREKFKDHGYIEPYTKYVGKDTVKIFMPATRNEYCQLYERGYGYRPSCRQCAFRKDHHVADFTISDAWSAVKPDWLKKVAMAEDAANLSMVKDAANPSVAKEATSSSVVMDQAAIEALVRESANKGVAIVQRNTEQAALIWQECLSLTVKDKPVLKAVDYEVALEKAINTGFTTDVPAPVDEAALFEDLRTKRFRKVVGKYVGEEKPGFFKRLFGRR